MRPGCDADNRKAATAFPWVGKSRLAAYVGVRQALARGSVALSAHAVGGSAARARGARTFLLGDGGLALGAVVAAGGFRGTASARGAGAARLGLLLVGSQRVLRLWGYGVLPPYVFLEVSDLLLVAGLFLHEG